MAADYCKLLDAIIRDPDTRIEDLVAALPRPKDEREEIVV